MAEAVFTPQHTLAGAQAFYADLKGRMAKHGRLPEHLKVMPGLNPIVGRTPQEAREKHRYLQSLIHPDVGLEVLSAAIGGFDLHGYDLDGPLPTEVDARGTNAGQTAFRDVVGWARNEGLTIRQLYERFAGARGQRTVIGTPEQIADDMEEWFVNRGVDGFLIQPSVLPVGLEDFVDLMIPELQQRGLFRRDYEGTTLRENLGLPQPTSRYATDDVAASG
jgi:alkanesulfonate monooxygenase